MSLVANFPDQQYHMAMMLACVPGAGELLFFDFMFFNFFSRLHYWRRMRPHGLELNTGGLLSDRFLGLAQAQNREDDLEGAS